MNKAVLFDLNGVLIRSEHLSERFASAYGVPNTLFLPALKAVLEVVRRPEAPALYSLFSPHFEEWELSLTEDEFLNFWFRGESLDYEALTYVQQIQRNGVKVYIVSNNFRERTEYYRSQFPELFANVDGAYFSWETGLVKPSVDALVQVLSQNNLKPHETLYFDDGEENVALAKKLGIRAQIWVNLQEAMVSINNLIRAVEVLPHITFPPHAQKVFEGVIFDVYQWEQELYDGRTVTFERLARPDTVTVYGVLPDGKILLAEQEQPGNPLCVGPTGGRVDPGEDALTAAKRELREESGYEADEWILWATTRPVSKIEWTIHTYVAKGLRKVSDQALDGGEKITLMPVSFDDFLGIATQDNFREGDVKLKVLEAKLDPEKMNELRKLFSL